MGGICLARCALPAVVALLLTVVVEAIQGSLRPLLDPVPALSEAPFLLRLVPDVAPPASAVQTRLVLMDLGVNLSSAGTHIIASSKGLPRVLQVGDLLGDGAGQVSFLLDAPLALGAPVEVLLLLPLQGMAGPIVAPNARVDVRYSTALRPEVFAVAEVATVPMTANVYRIDAESVVTEASVSLPAAPSTASTAQDVSMVTYRLNLEFANASVSLDTLLVAPLVALHSDFRVAHDTACPSLAAAGPATSGAELPWSGGSCRFVLLPPPLPGAPASASNALEIALGDGAEVTEPQLLELRLPAPLRGSEHGWLLMFYGLGGDTCEVQELGARGRPEAGLAVEPTPSGAVLSASSQAYGVLGVVVDLTVKPDIDLGSSSGGSIAIRPTSPLARITACYAMEVSTSSLQPLAVEIDGLTGVASCRMAAAGRYLGSDTSVHFRLVVDNWALQNSSHVTGLVGFSVAVTYAGGYQSLAQSLLGEYPLDDGLLLAGRLFAPGLPPLLHPLPFLVTFRTSAAASDAYTLNSTAIADRMIFPSWRAPRECTLGCERWTQTPLNASAAALALAGRACARPPTLPRDGPWCFCRVGSGQVWGYCRPEVNLLQLGLVDATKWQLLRASDGARLRSVAQPHAVDCALYLRSFAVGTGTGAPYSAQGQQRSATVGPRRCWGATMTSAGNSVYMEWWPGHGLVAGETYSLELMGIFSGENVQAGDALLRVSVAHSTTEGPYIVHESVDLTSEVRPVKKSRSRPWLTRRPVISQFTPQLLSSAGLPPHGHFLLRLLPGADEPDYLGPGDVVDIFLLPFSVWDVAAPGARITGDPCPPLRLTVPTAFVEPAQPTCRSYSIGADAVEGRHNALRLVLLQGAMLSAPLLVDTTLPLPAGGFLDVRLAVSVRHQAPEGESAWYQEADASVTWAPAVASAHFVGKPQTVAGSSTTVDLTFVPASMLRGATDVRLRVVPPSGFVVTAVQRLDDAVPGRLPALAGAPAEGGSYEVSFDAGSALFAQAAYIVRLSLIASPPSFAKRVPWHVQVVRKDSARSPGFTGPVTWLGSGEGFSAGVLVPGALRASLALSHLHASALSALTVYFLPAQTQGIFFRYLVLTAPPGFDFATVRSPPDIPSKVPDSIVIACRALSKLRLPPYIQCRPRRAAGVSEGHNIARVILPPLSRLDGQACGFSVEAVLPPFSSAWSAESAGDSSFSLETRTEDDVLTDSLALIEGAELPGTGEPGRPLSAGVLPVYPQGCPSAEIVVDELQPGGLSRARLRFEVSVDAPPPVHAYLHAPPGYQWHTAGLAWTASVTPKGSNATVSMGPDRLEASGACMPSYGHVLCATFNQSLSAGDVYDISATIRVPAENPDVPQSSGLLPHPPLWHLEMTSAAVRIGELALPSTRLVGCLLSFSEPNRIRRIYGVTATPTNQVFNASNDVALALTTVSTVPAGGSLEIAAPVDTFRFPNPCEIAETPAWATLRPGLSLPVAAGAVCRSQPSAPHKISIVFTRGALPPSSYVFTIQKVFNARIVDQQASGALWQVYSANASDYVDHPASFEAFSVLQEMQDAFVDTALLDPATTKFTKRRGATNGVVLCFRQSLATPAGQTLAVSLPDGFRVPWQDSDDCLSTDPQLGIPPVEILMPFGNVSVDPLLFAPFPARMQISCASSSDGGTALLTLSEELPEVSRYYALRLVVQNADQSPEANYWRLSIGQQASRPMSGFTMQAFQQISLQVSVTSSSPVGTVAPPNSVRIAFQPSVPVPAGGALRLRPPPGFALEAGAPLESHGVLLAAGARCAGTSRFLGTDYSYLQCEATCRQRPSCSFFSVGIGSRAGDCVQEGDVEAPGAPEPCQALEPQDSFSVYKMTATGTCYRFSLMEDAVARDDVGCAVEQGSLLVRLSVASLPFSPDKAYGVDFVVRNPPSPANPNTWLLQSFAQASLAAESLLDDSAIPGFELTPPLAHFEFSAEPADLRHTAGAVVVAVLRWAPSVAVAAGVDVVEVEVPEWFGQPPGGTCATVRAMRESAGYVLQDCQAAVGHGGVRVSFAGSAGALAAGERLDFSFGVRNPDVAMLRSLSWGDLALVSLTHLRPSISLDAKVRLVPVSSSAALVHTVHLPMLDIAVRQAEPQFAVAGRQGVVLHVDFRLQSEGADQVWLDSSADNPLDFGGARCAVALSGSGDAVAVGDGLFGQFACAPAGRLQLLLAAAQRTYMASLRVDVEEALSIGLRYRLMLEGVGAAPYPGQVRLAIAASSAAASADPRERSAARLLDSGSGGFEQCGRLALRPLGAGSFASLSADAAFGTSTYVAGDYVHFLTIGFTVETRLGSGDRIVLYPSPSVEVVNGSAHLDVGSRVAAGGSDVRMLQELPDDDVFSHAASMGLPRPAFLQRCDVLLVAGQELAPGGSASLRLQVQVALEGLGGQGGSADWLVLTSSSEQWRGAVSNVNLYEWTGGPPRAVPSFDAQASTIMSSERLASTMVTVTVLLAPVVEALPGRLLRIAAPPLFVWSAACVVATKPGALVGRGQCWRDGTAPNIVLLRLRAALRAKVAHHFVMEALTPSATSPPNLWEASVLQLPRSGETGLEVWQRHAEAVPEQVVRLPGFRVSGFEVSLEPQAGAPWAAAAARGGAAALPLLLLFRLSSMPAEASDLQLATLPLTVRVMAPYPLVAECVPESALSRSMGPPDAMTDAQLLAAGPKFLGPHGCAQEGWRGVGGFQVGSAHRSVLAFTLRDAVPVGQWFALRLSVRDSQPAGGGVDAGAGGSPGELMTALSFWSIQLSSARRGRALGAAEDVQARPGILLPAESSAAPSQASGSDLRCSGASGLCAKIAGSFAGPPPAVGVQLDRGSGISVLLELTLPRALAVALGAPGRRYHSAFANAAARPAFPAQVILGTYIHVTAPSPFRWSHDCVATQVASLARARWRAVCFGGDAYLSVEGYEGAGAVAQGPYQASLTISTISLVDPASPTAPLALPLSRTWTLSLFEAGALTGQLLLEAEANAGVARLSSQAVLGTAGSSSSNSTGVGLGVDSEDGCESTVMEEFPCPSGMYAYGVYATQLGGADSWLDSLQLLCREELDQGTMQTRWFARNGTTAVAGDVRHASRAAERAAGAEARPLECDATFSALLVGGRAEAWRWQRFLGFTVACMPWANVERGVPWDAESGSELVPRGVSDAEDGTGNCTSDAPVEGSGTWAACEELPDMRVCPSASARCCCIEGLRYSIALRRCVRCTRDVGTDLATSPWRFCPPGHAVTGFRAAVRTTPGGAGGGASWQAEAASICAVELLCGMLRIRHFVGGMVPPDYPGVVAVSNAAPEPVVEGSALTSFAGAEFLWWHYAAAGAGLLLVLCCLYCCCCRSSSSGRYYGDREEQAGALRSCSGCVRGAFSVLRRRVLAPLWHGIKARVLEPVYARILSPVWEYTKETRAWKRIVRVAAALGRLFERCCPCLAWCWRKRRRARAALAMMSPKSVAHWWQHGEGSPRMMAAALRRKIRNGELTPRSLKADLAKMLARGQITPRTFARRSRELTQATAGSPPGSPTASSGRGRRSLRQSFFSFWTEEVDRHVRENESAAQSARSDVEAGASVGAEVSGEATGDKELSRGATADAAEEDKGARSSGEEDEEDGRSERSEPSEEDSSEGSEDSEDISDEDSAGGEESGAEDEEEEEERK